MLGWKNGKAGEEPGGRLKIRRGRRSLEREASGRRESVRDDSFDRERERRREEISRKLKEARSPEKQALHPGPKDRLSFLPFSRFVVILGCIVITVLGLFTLTYLSLARNQLGAEVSRLTTEQERLKEANGHLKAKLERLVSLEDLELVSRESLGLSMPRTGQIVVLE
ncbi:MAG: hypothetical protein LBR53_06245 [Deltaproteobacteria bacterium]|jgi:hypothetical protein|nr:hypothetical protein [Deltaproteobacteria bacterium]